jgi:hypothetical protein
MHLRPVFQAVRAHRKQSGLRKTALPHERQGQARVGPTDLLFGCVNGGIKTFRLFNAVFVGVWSRLYALGLRIALNHSRIIMELTAGATHAPVDLCQ